MKMREINSILLSFLVAGITVFGAAVQTNPDETVVIVPAWKIQIVSPYGKAMRDVFVRQVWKDYDIEDSGREADARTDRNGFVSFPERRAPKISDAVRRNSQQRNLEEFGVHTSFGIHSSIFAWGKIVGCKRFEGFATYTRGKPLPAKLHTLTSTLPGVKCR